MYGRSNVKGTRRMGWVALNPEVANIAATGASARALGRESLGISTYPDINIRH